MGVIVRPDDMGSIMAEVYARLEAIERTSGPMHDFAIRDSSGNMRVQGGNLAAWGISPAQEGMRVIDAYGNPIFDTLGLSGVMQRLGSCSPSGLIPALPGGELPATPHVSVSVARPVTVLVLCTISVSFPAAGSMYAALALDLAFGGAFYYFNVSGAVTTPVTLYRVMSLAAGTHTVGVWGQWSGGTQPSVPVAYSQLDVFQLGG